MMETQSSQTESFKKRWSDATTIISHQDLQDAEQQHHNDAEDRKQLTRISIMSGTQERRADIMNDTQHYTDNVDGASIVKSSPQKVTPNASNKNPQGRPASLQLRDFCDLRSGSASRVQDVIDSSPCHGHFKTTGLNTTLSDLFPCEQSDWLLPDWRFRSLPSPAASCRSPEVASATMSSSSSAFNFSPELSQVFSASQGCRRVKRRLFADIPESESTDGLYGDVISSEYSLQHSSRDSATLHDVKSRNQVASLETDDYPINSPFRNNVFKRSSDRDQLKSKRPLDCPEYSNSKRVKIDVEREMGHRYIQRLESDIANIRYGLGQVAHVKGTSCTCAIMERQFLEMAESAYRKLRRSDASPRGFQQFRSELVQTNEVMKDSMEVLKNIRRFCEH